MAALREILLPVAPTTLKVVFAISNISEAESLMRSFVPVYMLPVVTTTSWAPNYNGVILLRWYDKTALHDIFCR